MTIIREYNVSYLRISHQNKDRNRMIACSCEKYPTINLGLDVLPRQIVFFYSKCAHCKVTYTIKTLSICLCLPIYFWSIKSSFETPFHSANPPSPVDISAFRLHAPAFLSLPPRPHLPPDRRAEETGGIDGPQPHQELIWARSQSSYW